MRGFKIPGNTPRFLSSMGEFLNLLKVKRSSLCAKEYREKLQEDLTVFEDIAATHPQSISKQGWGTFFYLLIQQLDRAVLAIALMFFNDKMKILPLVY